MTEWKHKLQKAQKKERKKCWERCGHKTWRGTCVSQGSRRNCLGRSVVWTQIWKMETAVEVKKGQSPGMRAWRWGWRGKKVFAAWENYLVCFLVSSWGQHAQVRQVSPSVLKIQWKDQMQIWIFISLFICPFSKYWSYAHRVSTVLADLGTLQCAKSTFSLLGLRGNVSHLEKIGNKNQSLNKGRKLLCVRRHSHTPGCSSPLLQKCEQCPVQQSLSQWQWGFPPQSGRIWVWEETAP